MTLLIVFCAGGALALVANVFALLAVAVAFSCICLVGLIASGATHPLAATAASLAALQVGYAFGVLASAYLPSRIALGRRRDETRARTRPHA